MVHAARPMMAKAEANASAVNSARRVPRDVVRARANIVMHAANSAHNRTFGEHRPHTRGMRDQAEHRDRGDRQRTGGDHSCGLR